MKKIFILDDIPERHKVIRETIQKNNPNESFEWYSEYTFYKAVETVQKHRFDLLCLDHDLGDHDPDNADRDYDAMCGLSAKYYTGADFCQFLVLNDILFGDIWIHSWNPAGAKNMKDILSRSGYYNITVQPVKM